MEELSVAFVNFINGLAAPFWTMLWAICALVGFLWLYFLALKMVRSTAPGATPISLGEVIGVIILATLVTNYASTLNAFSESVGMGDISFGVIAYVDQGGRLGKFSQVINAALTFAAMMGGVFGIKGLFLLWKKVKGENSGGDLALQGLIHIVAGGFLVQIAKLLQSLTESI